MSFFSMASIAFGIFVIFLICWLALRAGLLVRGVDRQDGRKEDDQRIAKFRELKRQETDSQRMGLDGEVRVRNTDFGPLETPPRRIK